MFLISVLLTTSRTAYASSMGYNARVRPKNARRPRLLVRHGGGACAPYPLRGTLAEPRRMRDTRNLARSTDGAPRAYLTNLCASSSSAFSPRIAPVRPARPHSSPPPAYAARPALTAGEGVLFEKCV
jgi:hypothetical protein